MRRELDKFKSLLRKEKLKYIDLGAEENYTARKGALYILMHFLEKMKRPDLAERLEKCKKSMKTLLISVIQINCEQNGKGYDILENVLESVARLPPPASTQFLFPPPYRSESV